MLQFFMKWRERYAPSKIWVIYSCVITSFINKLGVTLKGLPHFHRYLKMETSHYVCKKVVTFNADEVHLVWMTLQERNKPDATFYAVTMMLLYFGLLHNGEVRMIQVKDVKVTDNAKIQQIHVIFEYPRKWRNTGMGYYVPFDFFPIFERCVSEICPATLQTNSIWQFILYFVFTTFCLGFAI